MCLIVLAWHVVPGMPLMAAANRDEYFERPALPAAWWQDHPQVYAGRDLRGGGTWMGISRDGRFAALTNVRAPSERRNEAPSRGALVANYLAGTLAPADYIETLAPDAAVYNGFNLLVGDADTLIWYSNARETGPQNGKPLAPGIYGMSNGSLDTPWPKVVRAKAQFSSLLCQGAPPEAYFDMLRDTTRASDCRLPRTGIDIERERALSSICIETPDYGTRASTLAQLWAGREPVLLERTIRP
jgi:uncharacterized protein with NRDE domain